MVQSTSESKASKKEKNKQTVANDKEEGEEENARMYAAISFAFILIVIGVPLWWRTTEVYRVTLPYDDIAALAPQEDVGVAVNVYILTLESARADSLCSEIQANFWLSKLYRVKCLSRALEVTEKQTIGNSKSLYDLEKIEFGAVNPGEILFLEIPGLSRFTPNDIVVGSKRTVYISSEAGAKKIGVVLAEWFLRENTILQNLRAMRSPSEAGKDREARVRVPPSRGSLDILLSLALPSPEHFTVRWDIPKATQEFLLPFLDNLASIANFSVKSQVLYFTSLGVRPKSVNTKDLGPHYALSEEILPQVISPLEKKLGSHVSTAAGLGLVLYVPGCSEAPLHLYSKQGKAVPANALLSARWGGLVVLNPPREACRDGPATMDVPSDKVMGVFLAHLRHLLGIPDLEPITSAEILPLNEARPRLWEIDSLMRVRALEQLTSSTLTLKSLSQLLGQIGNIVIGDDVGESVFVATKATAQGALLLSQGKLLAGYDVSRIAFLESESAFTDPSLLALLYFPDDQKYAVYIPLFLPVMIPVLMSLKTIKNWFSRKMASRRQR